MSTSFTYYVEPVAIRSNDGVAAQSDVYVGLGEVAGKDRCALVTVEGVRATGVELTRDELERLITVLTYSLEAMDEEAIA